MHRRQKDPYSRAHGVKPVAPPTQFPQSSKNVSGPLQPSLQLDTLPSNRRHSPQSSTNALPFGSPLQSAHYYCHCRRRKHQMRRASPDAQAIQLTGSTVGERGVVIGWVAIQTPHASCWAVPPHTLLQSCKQADPFGRTVLSFDASLSQTPQSS